MDEPGKTNAGMGVVPQQPQPNAPELAAAIVKPQTSARTETMSRSFFGLSLKRGYRLNIMADEVLPQERAVLESEARHVTDPDQQAFLAWRRSVLLLVAM